MADEDTDGVVASRDGIRNCACGVEAKIFESGTDDLEGHSFFQGTKCILAILLFCDCSGSLSVRSPHLRSMYERDIMKRIVVSITSITYHSTSSHRIASLVDYQYMKFAASPKHSRLGSQP